MSKLRSRVTFGGSVVEFRVMVLEESAKVHNEDVGVLNQAVNSATITVRFIRGRN